MAFMHEHLYERVMKRRSNRQDATLAEIFGLYRAASASLADFGVAALSCFSFTRPIQLLVEMHGGDSPRQAMWEKMSQGSYKRLVQLISETTDSASTVIALLEARTPLDCATQLRLIIEELVKATEPRALEDNIASLATDDLIPLLAWILVQAGPTYFHSLLRYTKSFRFSSSQQGDLE